MTGGFPDRETISINTARTAAVLAAITLLAGCTSRSAEDPDPSTTSTPFQPAPDNQDPSTDIEGVELADHQGGLHAPPDRRVAYDRHPPVGGMHDEVWANCNGAVYDRAVRTEHMVHALEHGAVWIAYDPAALSPEEVALLAERVDGQPYLMLSPYPGIEPPIALQAWNHQLRVAGADDERIDQFIRALRDNEYTTPEPGAPCETDPAMFDLTNPPPFDPSPPGPDAVPVDGV
ncbi:DUF3105 domain-containing protein [Actinophytocola sediminis]